MVLHPGGVPSLPPQLSALRGTGSGSRGECQLHPRLSAFGYGPPGGTASTPSSPLRRTGVTGGRGAARPRHPPVSRHTPCSIRTLRWVQGPLGLSPGRVPARSFPRFPSLAPPLVGPGFARVVALVGAGGSGPPRGSCEFGRGPVGTEIGAPAGTWRSVRGARSGRPVAGRRLVGVLSGHRVGSARDPAALAFGLRVPGPSALGSGCRPW
jgi:hypothetical protein